MAMQAREYESFETLKIKLNASKSMETMAAIRNAVPTKRLVIDANEAWTLEELKTYAPEVQLWGEDVADQAR
jgi:L-alanine-DL-glutamate epimerase-like enolase superfamily enzyme